MAILLCSNGFQVFISPVTHIFDIGCTGVIEADVKSDSEQLDFICDFCQKVLCRLPTLQPIHTATHAVRMYSISINKLQRR